MKHAVDFNTICFRAKNVLSLYGGRAKDGRNRPFFVSLSPFQGETVPMTGFRKSHVGENTWHVVFPAPACMGNYKACRLRRMCRKVKNVNVG